jgi:predicted nucleic acid-binding protein
MKLIIVDTSALISLGLVGQIDLILNVFGEFYIPNAVWEELQEYENPEFDKRILDQMEKRVIKIKSRNHLSVIMDYGESESVILYEELNANYLLIDDNKARIIAESLNVNCIGSIGLLVKSKQKGLINDLRAIFEKWLENERYFSKKILNKILFSIGEEQIKE